MKRVVIALLVLCLLALCLTGCQQRPMEEKSTAAVTGEPARGIVLDDYLALVKAQSDAIKASLENDPMAQTELNQKSQELRALWDAALNTLLEEAKKVLPEAEIGALTAGQRAWLAEKEEAVAAAGKEVEGGSMYALFANSEAAALTEARVDVLYEQMKQANSN